MATDLPGGAPSSRWTFFSNHGHVLICLAQDSEARVRDVAERVGITERAVQSILSDLEQEQIVTRIKIGRRNHYEINPDHPLMHPIEAHRNVGDLIRMAAVE